MAKKVIIGKGKQKRYAVIYDEVIDLHTGIHHLKQKGFKTSEEADEFLEQLGSNDEIRIEMDQKNDESKQVPFSKFAKDWFYREQAQMIAAQTFRVRQVQLEKHIVPYFSEKYLQEITDNDLVGFYAEKRQEGYTDRFIFGIHAILKSLYQSAIQKGYLKRNPTKGVKNMFKDVDRTIWSNEEVGQFLKVANGEGEGLIYEFALGTGGRLGEILAVSWNDVDFEQGTVTVDRNVSLGETVEIRRGARTIALSAYLLSKLKEHKEKQQLLKEHLRGQSQGRLNLVFPKKDGGVQNPSVVQRKFAQLVEKAGVRKITFHGLRRTHINLLYDVGVSPDYIKNQLGDNGIKTTLNPFLQNS